MKRVVQLTPEPFSHRIKGGMLIIVLGFVFLLFQIWRVCYATAGVEHALKQINSELAGSPADKDAIPVEVIIDLAADGAITLNEEGQISDLAAELKRLVLLNRGQKLIVTVSCHEDTPYGKALEVLEKVDKAGIKNVTFAVGSEEF